MTQRWRARVEALLAAHPRLLAVSVHNKLRAEGFCGSYPTVARAVRDVRGPRFRAAAAVSVPIHTDPGEEIQFDFCNLDHIAAEWGWDHPLRVFGAISSWSRQRLWWCTTSEDREHTFEGIVRSFEAFGGVPAVARTDRMGALGTSREGRASTSPAHPPHRSRRARPRAHRSPRASPPWSAPPANRVDPSASAVSRAPPALSVTSSDCPAAITTFRTRRSNPARSTTT